MEGLLKFNDLEEHFSNSLIIIDQRNGIIKGNRNLEVIVEQLNEEGRILKQSEQKLTQQLRILSCSTEDQDGITSLYRKLKGKYGELQDKFNQLEKEKVEFAEKAKWKNNEITEDYRKQMRDMEERKEDQEKELLKTKSDLHNRLTAQQAAADIRYDEMESNLKLQIKDISEKLHDSIQSCNTLRQELFSFKSFNNSEMDSSKKRIQELERELRLSKQQLQMLKDQNQFNSTNLNVYPNNNNNLHREINQPRPTISESDRPNIVKNRIVVYNENPHISTSKPNYVYGTTKYPSLKVGAGMDQEASSSEEFPEPLHGNVNRPIIIEPVRNLQSGATSLRYDAKQSNKKYTIPPLRPLTSTVAQSKQRNDIKKKRKLYDPHNLDYLHDMESLE